MRYFRFFALMPLCALTTALLSGASLSEVRETIHPGEQKVQDIRFGDLLATPSAYQNARVRFRCMFIESGNLFDREHTFFKPYTHANLIVWDERAEIWNPQVRANPLTSVYISKDRVDASRIAQLNKYQIIELLGEVVMVESGVPYFSVHTLSTPEENGRYSDVSIYHVQQGVQLSQLADKPEADRGGDKTSSASLRALSEDNFAAALTGSTPLIGKVAIGHLRSQNLLSAGDFAGCARIMKEVIDLAETDLDLSRQSLGAMHYLMAKALIELEGGNTLAVSHARKAVALDPELGDAYAVLGITLAATGQFDEARRQCEKAIRLRPTNAEIRWYLGRILDQQGAFEEAADSLRKAIDLTPRDGRLHKALAMTHLHRGQKGNPVAMAADLSSSLQEFNIANNLNRADAEAVYGAGYVLENASTNKIAELSLGTSNKIKPTLAMAIERYKAAVAIDGSYLPARRSLAAYYRANNMVPEAIVQYKAIIQVDVTRAESWSDLASYFMSLDRKDDAWVTYQDFLKQNSTSASAKLIFAQAAFDMGKNSEGLLVALQLTEADPNNGPAWLLVARFQLVQGLPKDAKKSAEHAFETAADDAAKAQAQEVLARAQTALDAR